MNNLMTDLAQSIQELQDERKQHADAIDRIDQTLQNVRAALGEAAGVGRARRGRPPKALSAAFSGAFGGETGGAIGGEFAPAAGRGARRRGRRRTRARYETTGDESVLNFVRSNRNPTTKEIKQHWASESRGGTADNVLSKLVREGKLKRTQIPDDRGSRYSLI